jgi:hypothetical protein
VASRLVPVPKVRFRRRLLAWALRCPGPLSILECRRPAPSARPQYSTAAAHQEAPQALARELPALRRLGSAAPSTGMASTSSVSRLGIPLGSTEIGVGGLSPPSVALTPNPLAPLMTLTPLVVTANSTAPLSTLGSTAPCLTTGTGTLSIAGGPSTFGSPLATGIPPTAGMGTSTSC